MSNTRLSPARSGNERGWFVYVVECVDGTLYTGCTTDVSRRVKEHNSGKRGAKYTRSRRPVVLRAVQACDDRSSALRREAEIKRMSRSEKLSLIISLQKITT